MALVVRNDNVLPELCGGGGGGVLDPDGLEQEDKAQPPTSLHNYRTGRHPSTRGLITGCKG